MNSAAQRTRVIQLYRQILKLGKTWKAKEEGNTASERLQIIGEARQTFRENKQETDPETISKLIYRAEQRIVQAEHYGIPYARPEYLPPDTAYSIFTCPLVVSHQIRYQFQINVIKSLISALEKEGIVVPDAIFDRLGELMGMKDGDFVDRVYLTEEGDAVLCVFSESVNQLSMGTTGLSVWQASCHLANLFRLIPSEKDYCRIIELGSGCGVSGIGIGRIRGGSEVILTDYDQNVLDLLEKNAKRNGMIQEDPSIPSQAKVRCLDWLNFDLNEWNEQPADLIIAADVVYDTALLGSLCRVLRLLLSLPHSQAAIVACTRRNESSLDAFEHHLKNAELSVVEKFEYENDEFRFENDDSLPFPSIFPFFSTLKTPTIFYNIQIK